MPSFRYFQFSSTCSAVGSYGPRKACADRCLSEHKQELRRQEAERRQRMEERRKKEAEALLQASHASNVKAAGVMGMAAMALFTLAW